MNDALVLDNAMATSLRRLESGALPYRVQLAARLATLRALYAEDYEGADLSASAVDALVGFLESNGSPGEPEVTATPAGDIYAEWQGPDGRRLTIEFLASGEVRYLVFCPNPKHPHRVDRLTGTTTADSLADIIVPFLSYSGLAA